MLSGAALFPNWRVVWCDLLGGSDVKASASNVGDQVRSLGGEDTLEKGMATCSSILAWRIPCTEEPGTVQSIGLQSRT